MSFNSAIQNMVAQKKSGMMKAAPNVGGMKGMMQAEMPQPRVAPSATVEQKAKKKLQTDALAGRR